MAVFDLYVRVSRVAGREGDSYISPSEQEKKGKAWLKANGHKLGKVKVDEDESGAKERRPGLDYLIERVERGESAGIVCAKLDRFGRNVEQILRNYKRVADADGQVVFVEDDIDPSTPMGKALFIIVSLFAEMVWNQTRDSWRDAVGNSVERGIHNSGAVPTGYAKGEDKRLVPDPLTAPLITEAFKLAASGMNKGDICDALNEQADTFYFGRSTLYGILRNRVYLGEARGGDGFVKENAHKPLTDLATWLAAQAAPRVGKIGDSDALLSGIVRCSGCRRSLRLGWSRKKGAEKCYTYSCRRRHSVGRCGEPASIKAADLERAVEEHFWKLAEDQVAEGAADNAALEGAEVELANAKAERKAWVQDTRAQALASYIERCEFLEAAEEEAAEKVAAIRSSMSGGVADLISIRDVWAELTNKEKRELFASVIGCVFVRKAQARGESVEDRTLVFAKGAEPELPRRGGHSFPIMPFAFAD